MVTNTAKLGGTASVVTVGKVGHGLMSMTPRAPDPKRNYTDEDAFAAIKASVDAMPAGVKMFLNSAEFYGPNLGTGNLELLARFYEKYPGYAEKTFLSVKGGTLPGTPRPDSSPENLRRSVDTCIAALRGTKKVDLFETARVAQNVSVEDAMKTLVELKNEGKFDHIGMSECGAESLRRAHAVHPVAAVEIEVSLWSYEEETKKVIQAAKELGIAVIAYSPLGSGFLTGSITSPQDIPEGDYRRRFARFQEDNFKANLAIVEAIKEVAARKSVTPAQLSIAWVAALGPQVIPLPGGSTANRILENIAGGDVELTQEELDEIAGILEKHEVHGGRYLGGAANSVLHLWG